MKILYVAMRYDYGIPEQGLSFEHTNFYDALSHMGHKLIYFDFMELTRELGKERLNKRLREVVDSERPDLMFCVLFGNELDPEVVRDISLRTDTTTLNWFCDDHWRFESFSRHWAPAFNWVVTTARSAVPKYRAIGYANAIKSQWACNQYSYRRLPVTPEYDVTFVGLPHGERPDVIAYLRRNGVDVRVWGKGWDSGRLGQDELVEVFNRSRINLNFSNASSRPRLRRWIRFEPQIKARNFEIPGCGGFELSGRADDLDSYFRPDREIVTFGDRRELLRKIRHYLDNEDLRQAIADAGHQRVVREHTYDIRFAEIFSTVGLSGTSTATGPRREERSSAPA